MGGMNFVMMDGHVLWHSLDDFKRIVSTQGYDGAFFDWGGKNQ
jgi:prepilin-type processing-associated H-X9-DG protein